MAIFESKWPIGHIVYLKTDKEQAPRIITAISFRPEAQVIYYLSCGPSESTHYEMEISEDKNFLFSIT